MSPGIVALVHPQTTVDSVRRLLAAGVPVREVARLTALPLSTLRHWRSGDRRSDSSSRRVVTCPRCTTTPLDEAAYAYLLGCYLGDGHITSGRRGEQSLSIFCADDWPGIRGEVTAALRAVMSSSSVCRVQRQGCAEVKSYSTHWICLFPQHGPGRKHERPIVLEKWQERLVARHSAMLVRGLVHSDGCRSINRIRGATAGGTVVYAYPRYFFSNRSRHILHIYCSALDRLGIAWRRSGPNVVSVARRQAVRRLDEIVGPKY